MLHKIKKRGYLYSLRPVKIEDAAFIVDLRTADIHRSKFIHKTSSDVSLQEKWIEDYFLRENDFYFVIENNITTVPEGVVGIYDVDMERKTAEWGRWCLKKDSLAAVESVELVFQTAFEDLNLDEIYSRTVADNEQVCAFHNSIGQQTRKILKAHAEIDGVKYDSVEHFVSKKDFYDNVQNKLTARAKMIFERDLKLKIGTFDFHHIGIAVRDIKKELNSYKILGYSKESEEFDDALQGIRGLFITAKSQPRLELLANLQNSSTLDFWLNNKIKMYHTAYKVANFDEAMDYFIKAGLKIVSEPQLSTAFTKRISFLMLPNMSVIELIEA